MTNPEYGPHLRVNGWHIKLTTIIQMVLIVVGGVTAWYNMSTKLETALRELDKLGVHVQESEKERQISIDKLMSLIQAREVDQVRIQEQIANVQLLIGDIRKRIDMIDQSQERYVDPTRVNKSSRN